MAISANRISCCFGQTASAVWPSVGELIYWQAKRGRMMPTTDVLLRTLELEVLVAWMHFQTC
jgi:hypothetical protein